jgi:calcium/calmodulin-dependent protein kinase I
LDKLYSKKVDSWSIGIITYLMVCGFLPFDDEVSIKEIAKKTVNEKLPMKPKYWKNLTYEVWNFVEGNINYINFIFLNFLIIQ